MDKEWVVAVEPEFSSDDMHVIATGLTQFNASHANGDVPRYVVVSVRNASGEIVGGLLGALYLGWMQVYALWLPDALRGKGLGTALLHQAEQEALRAGCPRMFLETLSFQAPGFYEKRGYTVFSRLDGFPPGGARYALTKMLGEEDQ